MKKKNFFKSLLFIVSCIGFTISIMTNSSINENIINLEVDIPVLQDIKSKEEKTSVPSRDYISVKNSNIYKNENYMGTLSIINTNFKEPLYQYRDNDYYLTHDGLGKKKSSGATFVDYRVNVDSKKILIYGHNNDSLTLPFSILENYNYFEYYQEHNYLLLDINDTLYKYKIFSVYVETGNWDYMKIEFATDELWLKHLQDLKSRSIYDTSVDIESNDQILILQTCSKNLKYKDYSKKYMLVIAKLVKE